MLLDVGNALRNPGQAYACSFKESFGPFEFNGRLISFARPVELEAQYSFTGEDVIIRGSFGTALLAQCDRCLKNVVLPVDVRFDETFSDKGEEAYPIEDEKAGLDKMVMDLIVLSFPPRVLCREDCRGLCPQCGRDLNESGCACSKDEARDASPFRILKDMFRNDEEV